MVWASTACLAEEKSYLVPWSAGKMSLMSDVNNEGQLDLAMRNVSARLAHDLNNQLTPLLAYPDMIRSDLAEDSRGRKLLGIMEKTAAGMAELTRQLLDYSSDLYGERRHFSMNDLVVELVSSIEGDALPESSKIVVNTDESLPTINGLPELLGGAVMALIDNALESRVRRENVCVEVQTGLLGDTAGIEGLEQDRSYVFIAVKDNGCGISKMDYRKIFDPFFTTKNAVSRKGLGLGLTIARRVLLEHNATIELDSSPEVGSVFTMYFPV